MFLLGHSHWHLHVIHGLGFFKPLSLDALARKITRGDAAIQTQAIPDGLACRDLLWALPRPAPARRRHSVLSFVDRPAGLTATFRSRAISGRRCLPESVQSLPLRSRPAPRPTAASCACRAAWTHLRGVRLEERPHERARPRRARRDLVAAGDLIHQRGARPSRSSKSSSSMRLTRCSTSASSTRSKRIVALVPANAEYLFLGHHAR